MHHRFVSMHHRFVELITVDTLKGVVGACFMRTGLRPRACLVMLRHVFCRSVSKAVPVMVSNCRKGALA